MYPKIQFSGPGTFYIVGNQSGETILGIKSSLKDLLRVKDSIFCNSVDNKVNKVVNGDRHGGALGGRHGSGQGGRHGGRQIKQMNLMYARKRS